MKFNIQKLFNDNLVFKKKEKLSKLTLLFIILLNIFILTTLIFTIDLKQSSLIKPNMLFPDVCRSIIFEKNITNFNNYFYKYETQKKKLQDIPNTQINKRCQTLVFSKLLDIQKEHDIKELSYKERILLIKQKEVEKELAVMRDEFYPVLHKKVSNDKIAKYIIIDNIPLETIKQQYSKLKLLNENITNKNKSLYRSFLESKSVENFITYIKENKKNIIYEYREYKNLYKLKKDFIIFIIFFPFFVISFSLIKKYKEDDKYIFFLISKNIFYITLMPLLISFIFLCSELIPQNFISKILEYNFPFYIYYVSVLILIMILGFVSIRLQDKYINDIRDFSNESISRIDSYYKNICNICVSQVDYETMTSCPTCDNELKIVCNSCESYTIKDLNYCVHCGEDIKPSTFEMKE